MEITILFLRNLGKKIPVTILGYLTLSLKRKELNRKTLSNGETFWFLYYTWNR